MVHALVCAFNTVHLFAVIEANCHDLHSETKKLEIYL